MEKKKIIDFKSLIVLKIGAPCAFVAPISGCRLLYLPVLWGTPCREIRHCFRRISGRGWDYHGGRGPTIPLQGFVHVYGNADLGVLLRHDPPPIQLNSESDMGVVTPDNPSPFLPSPWGAGPISQMCRPVVTLHQEAGNIARRRTIP